MKIKDHFLSGDFFELQETEFPGVLKTSPIPENLSSYYESKNYISHHQDSGSIKEKLYKFLQKINLNYKRNVVVKEVGVEKKILDFGCGVGDFVKFMEKENEMFGYEPNKEAISFSQKKSSKAIFFSNLEDIKKEKYDGICLWHVLEHLEDQEKILDIFYQQLNPSGKLILALPNHDSYDAKKYKEFWAAYDVPRHLWHYSKTGMLNYMKNSSWKIVDIKPLLLDSYYISLLSEKYKKNPLFFIKGLFFGAISNFKASKSGEFSSLIYILEKK